MPKRKMVEILSYLLIIYSALVMLALVLYFAKHSPDYLTHDQFATSMIAFGSAVFAGFGALWVKMMNFAQCVGRIEGKLDGIGKINSSSQENMIPSLPPINIQNVQQQGRSKAYVNKNRKS